MAALLIVAPVAVALISVVLGRAATQIDPTVPDGDVVGGLLIAAAAAAFAVVVFYTAGYLVRPGWLLAVILVILAVPYLFYLFLALLWVLALVYCGPAASG